MGGSEHISEPEVRYCLKLLTVKSAAEGKLAFVTALPPS